MLNKYQGLFEVEYEVFLSEENQECKHCNDGHVANVQ